MRHATPRDEQSAKTNNYRFAHAYVFHDGNVETVDGIEYLPIYMIGCLLN